EELVALVRAHTHGAGDTEIRAALAPLTPAEEKRLQRMLRKPPAGIDGPAAWADLARGTDPTVVAARELSGYYALLAERDALAALAKKPPMRAPVKPSPPPSPAAGPPPLRRSKPRTGGSERAQH